MKFKKWFLVLSTLVFCFLYARSAVADLSVTLTAPANGEQFAACSDILFTADAQNTEGDVKYIFFFVDGKNKKRDSREPFEWEWRKVQTGEYVVWVVAEDAEGNQAESDRISITVGEPVPWNIVVNGNFDCGLSPWRLQLFDVAAAQANVLTDGLFDDSNYLQVTVSDPGQQPWSVQLHQPVNIDSGHVYEITFLADAPEEKTITVLMQSTVEPYKEYFNQSVTVDQFNEYGPYVFEPDTSIQQIAFKFILGNNTKEIYIDDVRVIDVTALASAVESRSAVSRVKSFDLQQNYPNPFNPSTQIQYSINKTSHVKLAVYNALGDEVAVLVDGSMSAGHHNVQLDASLLSTGSYLYRLEVDGKSLSRKLMLLK